MKFKIPKKIFLSRRISKSSLINIEGFFIAFCLFHITPPFYVWSSIIPPICSVICSLLLLKNIDKNRLGFFVGFLIFYSYFTLKNGANLFGLVIILCVCTFSIAKTDFLKNIFQKYIYIYSILLIPSIIVFICINYMGIDFPHSNIEPLNILKVFGYFQYPFLVQEDSIAMSIFPRFFGYFDEPGVVGTVSAVLMMCERFNLKKIINIPIFIAGILSFSLAFYLSLMLYGFIFLSMKYKFIIAIIIISSIFLIQENNIIYQNFLSRFVFENGKLTGLNRTTSYFDKWYEEYKTTGYYYFGIGLEKTQNRNYGGASYKDLIVAYGIIPISLFIVWILLFAFSQLKFRKVFFVYIFVLFTIIYQRPFITTFFYGFLIFASISFLAKANIKTVRLKNYFPLWWRFFKYITSGSKQVNTAS